MTVHSSCKYLARSISNAVSDEKDPDDIDTTTDDHALDTWRFGAMSRPAPLMTSTMRRRYAEGTMGALRQSVQRVTRRLGSESVQVH